MVHHTSQKWGIHLSGDIIKCVACALSKDQTKPINKINLKRSTLPGERICLDISYVEDSILGGKQYWVLMVDEATGMKWCTFVALPSDLSDTVIIQIKDLRTQQCTISYIKCDNAGENKVLKQNIIKEKYKR